MRALYERPTQLKRHPDGAEGEAIYQKRVPEKRPEWIETARVTFPSGRHADELCVTEVAQVAWAANLATIDFHPWPSRRAHVDNPDELRIDLDPQPGTTFKATRRRWRSSFARCWTSSASRAGRRRPARRGIHILACRSSRAGRSPRCAGCAKALARGGRAADRRPRRSRRRPGGRWSDRRRLRRLRPERARPDDRLGVLDARPARRDRLRSCDLG